MVMDTFFYFDDDDSHALERNHTHFLLLDDGKYHSQYLYNEINELCTPEINRQPKLYRQFGQHEKGSVKINIKIPFYCFLLIYFCRDLE